jgi:hypothetical protein
VSIVYEERWKQAEAEVARLQAIVDKLPKTADGVAVVPPVSVWIRRQNGRVDEMWVSCIDWFAQQWIFRNWSGPASPQPGTCQDITKAYSTRSAAKAAGGE